ncbi:DUF397 domain-containing protein [Actinomadura mexicana]|uniref:DUF397 domain-containing protein n=1 Tax=Actinomadura mexicana TaxID=134959 RepID=A0A239EW28_9ACTN|nr:protein of unknown function [Actinomadura mexicana]
MMNLPNPTGLQWRKASRSDHHGGACIEVASAAPAVGVRDSKDPDGPILIFAATEWRTFVRRVKDREHDLI